MTSSLRLGQLLQGQGGIYTVARQLQDTVWLATRTQSNQPVIVKSVHHFRLQNERDVLKRFQSRTPFIRPLLDEIADPPAIVLRHLDDHLLNASASRKLTSQEIKYVAWRILEALNVLHEDGFVHTDIKPDNILVNYGQGNVRFAEVQVADCGSTVHSDSAYARDGDLIGAPIWRSPEAQLRIRWGTPTDIWSFGALLITLLYGDNFFIFKPDVPADHDEYELRILQRQCEFFGPFPLTYREICPPEKLNILAHIMQSIPPEKKKPFSRITDQEVSKEDKDFILKIMRLDPRDRPSAADLLRDKWFNNWSCRCMEEGLRARQELYAPTTVSARGSPEKMLRTRQLLNGEITYSAAKEKETNVLHSLNYCEQRAKFRGYLNQNRHLIKAVVLNVFESVSK